MKKTLLIVLGAIGAAGMANVQGQTIDVQFNDDSINLIYDGGAGSPSPLPVMTGAAVVGSAGDVWNQVTSANLTYASPPLGATTVSPVALNNVNGAPTGVSLTLSAPNGTYNANSVYWGNYSPFTTAGSPYSALMQTCLVANNGSGPGGNVTLTGLAVGQAYNLYVYTASDENAAPGRTGTFSVGANSQNYTWDGVTSTLVNGVSYLEFAGVTSVGGTLVIDFGNATAETDFNGLQLVAVPEPGTLALLGMGLPLFFIRRRK
jgi:hypothetical protein